MGDMKIITSTPLLYSVDQDWDDIRFQKVRISVMHSGANLNHSEFSTSVIKKAKDTFKNIAVLANVVKYVDENGNETLDFGGHDGHFEDDQMNPGQDRYITDEKVIGIVPETNDFEIVHDDEHDWDVPMVTAYIYKDYSGYVTDILEKRGGKTDVSAEIYCPDISVNAETGNIVVNQMIMSGITLLGEQVQPAMTGSQASVFSIKEDDKQQQLIDIMRELKDSLDKYTALHDNAQNLQKGGKPLTKLEELKDKFNVTDEDIDFETEGLSDEELEAKFNEQFGENSDPEPTDSVEEEAPTEEEKPVEAEESTESTDPEAVEESTEVEESEPNTNTVKYSVNGKEFSVSLSDIQYALTDLVNQTYESDGDYYFCDVYLDDKIIVMHGYSGKSYRVSYKVRNDQYSLVGDRIEVHAVWMSDDEEKSFDNMKNNYSSISEELNKYHDEPKKAEILNSEVYSTLSEDKDYQDLVQNHFDMSVEDVQKKADEILLNSVKQHKFSYSAPEGKKTTSVKPLPLNKKSKRNFGSLFDGII